MVTDKTSYGSTRPTKWFAVAVSADVLLQTGVHLFQPLKMSADEKKQAERTMLRERFLRAISSISDLPTEFTMCNHSQIKAVFSACDVDILHFQVDKLQTPLGTQPSALLRTNDIVSFNVDLGSQWCRVNWERVACWTRYWAPPARVKYFRSQDAQELGQPMCTNIAAALNWDKPVHRVQTINGNTYIM